MKLMLRRLPAPAKPLLVICALILMPLAARAVNPAPSVIAGTDADADGVRDDVGAFIREQWPDGDLRFWAFEAARAGQAYLLSNGNRYALHRAHAFMARARRCLTETHDPNTAREVINRVLGVQLDSYQRRQHYQEALNLWVHKLQHEALPSKPDDDWSESCELPGGSASFIATRRTANTELPDPDQHNETLPPPNFFLDEQSAGTRVAPSGSVSVQALTGASEQDPTHSQTSPAGTELKLPSGWTTYSPRPRPKPAEPASRLPVQKLRAGQSAADLSPATQTAIRTQAARTSPPLQPARAAEKSLPPSLQELAPFIRSIERR